MAVGFGDLLSARQGRLFTHARGSAERLGVFLVCRDRRHSVRRRPEQRRAKPRAHAPSAQPHRGSRRLSSAWRVGTVPMGFQLTWVPGQRLCGRKFPGRIMMSALDMRRHVCLLGSARPPLMKKTKGKISIWLGYPRARCVQVGQPNSRRNGRTSEGEILTFELREFEAKLAVSVRPASGPDISRHDFIFPRYYEGGNLADVRPTLPRTSTIRRSSIPSSRISSRATASLGACRVVRPQRLVLQHGSSQAAGSTARRRPTRTSGNTPRS